MPYFVHIESRTVVVTAPGNRLADGHVEIPADIAQRYSLAHGVTLTAEQFAEVQSPTGAVWASPARPAPTASTSPTSGVSAVSVARGAEQVALAVEVIAWVLAAIVVLAGVILALTTRGSEFSFEGQTHPFVGAGIGVAVGGLFQCLIVVMLARYIRVRMMLVRQSHR